MINIGHLGQSFRRTEAEWAAGIKSLEGLGPWMQGDMWKVGDDALREGRSRSVSPIPVKDRLLPISEDMYVHEDSIMDYFDNSKPRYPPTLLQEEEDRCKPKEPFKTPYMKFLEDNERIKQEKIQREEDKRRAEVEYKKRQENKEEEQRKIEAELAAVASKSTAEKMAEKYGTNASAVISKKKSLSKDSDISNGHNYLDAYMVYWDRETGKTIPFNPAARNRKKRFPDLKPDIVGAEAERQVLMRGAPCDHEKLQNEYDWRSPLQKKISERQDSNSPINRNKPVTFIPHDARGGAKLNGNVLNPNVEYTEVAYSKDPRTGELAEVRRLTCKNTKDAKKIVAKEKPHKRKGSLFEKVCQRNQMFLTQTAEAANKEATGGSVHSGKDNKNTTAPAKMIDATTSLIAGPFLKGMTPAKVRVDKNIYLRTSIANDPRYASRKPPVMRKVKEKELKSFEGL